MKNFLTFGLLITLANTTSFAMLQPQQASCTDGRTPLMIAVLRGAFINEDFIEKHKDTIDMQDASGRTALHHAAAFDQKIVVRLLIEKKADRSIRDNEGYTAEDIARIRDKIRAHNDDRSYEHCTEQYPNSPTDNSNSPTELTTLYAPRLPIEIGYYQSEELTSPNSLPKQKYDSRFPNYASLL